MAGIEIAFVALEIIALVIKLGNQHMAGRRRQRLVVGQQRRLARSHIRKDNPGTLLTWIGGLANLLAKTPVRRLAGLLDAAALTVKQPAMVQAAQAAVFDAAVTQIGAPMGAVLADQAELAVGVPEQDQIFAHNPYRQRRAVAGQLFDQGDRVPVAAQ